MNNDLFDNSAPERFFPASMVTEGVKENRHSIEELGDRLVVLERAAAFHNPCQGARAAGEIAHIKDRQRSLELTVYTVGSILVLILAFLTAGLVWVVTGADERVDQIEKEVRSR